MRIILAHLAQDRVEDAVDEARSVEGTERLRALNRLVDRALRRDRLIGRDRVAVEHLDQRDAQNAALERRDPLNAPAVGVATDQVVELRRAADGRAREGTGG